MYVYFISEDYLKATTPIDLNVDDRLLQPTIRFAQDKYIQTLVGTGIWEDLKTQITGNTLTASYRTLLDDFIAPCLSQWTWFEALTYLYFKMTNKSISKQNDEYSNPIDIEDLKYLRGIISDNAEFLGKRITNYLLANQTLFPKYLAPGSTIDTIIPVHTQYDSGIFFDGDGRANNYGSDGWCIGMIGKPIQ